MEERRLLLAQRNLESIRLIAELLARAKVHKYTAHSSGCACIQTFFPSSHQVVLLHINHSSSPGPEAAAAGEREGRTGGAGEAGAVTAEGGTGSPGAPGGLPTQAGGGAPEGGGGEGTCAGTPAAREGAQGETAVQSVEEEQ